LILKKELNPLDVTEEENDILYTLDDKIIASAKEEIRQIL
jgi:hypothetical protein